MSRFTQREVPVPGPTPPSDSAVDQSHSQKQPNWPRSGSNGFNSSPQPKPAAEPAIPDSLFDALNREPPPSLNNPDWVQPQQTRDQPRSSFSISRPNKSTNLSAFPVTHNPPAQAGNSPLLPSLPPSSPLGFAYASASPTTSPARTAFGPACARAQSSLTPEEAYTTGGSVPRSPSGSSSGLGRQRSNDSGERGSVAGTAKSRTQSMWNSVKFGAKGRSSSDDRESSASGGSRFGAGGGARLSGSSRSALGFATTSASPVSATNNPALVPAHSSDSSYSGAPPSPTTRSRSPPSRRASGLAPTSTSGVVHRRPSAIALNKPSGGRDQGSKWLYEAQEAAALASRTAARKNSTAQAADPRPVVEAEEGLEASGEEDEAEAAELAAKRRSGRRRSRRAGQSVSADDSQDSERQTWGIRRNTEQYTHDLGPAALGAAYHSDAEESGTDSSGTDGEGDFTVDYTPETDQGELDGAEGEVQGLESGVQELSLGQYTGEDDARTIGMPSPLMVTPRGSTSGPSGMLGSGSFGERRRSSAATVTGAERVHPVIERLRQMGPTHEEPLSPTQTDYPPAPPPTAASVAPSLRVSTADFVVAVVGPRNVGKSTVIRRGLKRTTAPPEVVHRDEHDNQATITACHFNIANQPRTIEVLEIDMALLQYNSEGVVWPAKLPPCQGAMLCYDATDPNALEGLKKLLKAFWTRGSDVPLIVLACKADPELGLNATDPNEAAKACNVYGAGIVNLDGGVDDKGRKMKESFNWMVRTIMDNRGEPRRPSSAMSGSRRSSAAPDPRPQAVGGQGRDSPTKPRSATRVTFDNPFGEGAVTAAPSVASGEMRGPRGSLGLGLTVVEEAPVGSAGAGRKMSVAPPQAENQSEQGLHPQPTAPALMVTAGEPTRVPAEVTKSVNKTSALDLHFSKEDMIDKFLFAAVTGNDEQYVTLFLVVFRRFARPLDVLSSLIGRFNFVQGRIKTDPLLSRFAQIKLCGVLSTWFLTYPGDFTAPPTYAMIDKFVNDIIPNGQTWVAHYATELHHRLRDVRTMPDPEASWALPDKSLDDTPQLGAAPFEGGAGFRRPSVAPSMESASSQAYSLRASDSVDGFGRLSVPGSTAPSSLPGTRGRRESDAATIESVDTGRGSTRSKGGAGGAQAVLLDLSNTLLDVPEDRIALQITRIAWQAFAEMTPRDLMRHVLAPRDPKNPRTHLRDPNSSVMRSINFVNYLAEWVASMILVQAKAKWRARMLEKFITVAYALRDQENFDSLMGVLAGINRQTIHRLAETQELVNLKLEGDKTKVPKRLRSLNKLMSNQKSFSAYRLALANSGTNMVPYLGVHLQDITVVNEVKKDMRDGKVNWSKFSQMGRSAAIVLDCARVAPRIEVELKVEGCILGVPLLGEEQQYELSYAYQPRAGGGSKQVQAGGTRSKLRTFVDKVSQQN